MEKSVLKIMIMTLVMSIMFSGGAYAESSLEQISAYLNRGITLTWNGETFYPLEEDGTRVYPITYNDRTYLPVKFVAEKAGLTVEWEGETQTVSLSNTMPQTVVENNAQAVLDNGISTETALEQISAYINKGVTLTWNGEAFYPQEDDGTRVYPITYNNRTYLPIKFVAEKAGLVVVWDEVTQTVALSAPTYVTPSTPNTGNGGSNRPSRPSTPSVPEEGEDEDTPIVASPQTPIITEDLTAGLVTEETAALPNGTYSRIGSGKMQHLAADFSAFTAIGCNVEEKMAVDDNDTHSIKISLASGDELQKRQTHINVLNTICENFVHYGGWSLGRSTELENGHLEQYYWQFIRPIELNCYSSDEEVVFVISKAAY